MIYIASPYSHKNDNIRRQRFNFAKLASYYVLSQSSAGVYSPVVHWHEIAETYNLRFDADFWRKQNELMLKKSSHLYVVDIPGWEESAGVTYEREFAQKLSIPIRYIMKSTLQAFAHSRNFSFEDLGLNIK